MFQKVSCIEKVYAKKVDVTKFSRLYFVSQCRNFLYRNLPVFQKVWGIEKDYARKGDIMIFCGFFLSHSAERFRVGALLCIRIILVSRKIIHKRRISQFLSQFFRITMPKIFRQESFSNSESFGYQKKLCRKGGYHERGTPEC